MTKSASPYKSLILLTASLSKNATSVLMPLSLAILAGAEAGSTPHTFVPRSLNSFKQDPSFEPTSTTRDSDDKLHLCFAQIA